MTIPLKTNTKKKKKKMGIKKNEQTNVLSRGFVK